jgi:alpha 1,2-mannosyltransferase
LDQDGGFFYERWGDAPVHSIGAALTLKKEEIHFFNDIAYYHVPFTHCPTGDNLRLDLGCHCDPGTNFDWNGYSCTSRCQHSTWYWLANFLSGTARFFEINHLEKPQGYEQEQQ